MLSLLTQNKMLALACDNSSAVMMGYPSSATCMHHLRWPWSAVGTQVIKIGIFPFCIHKHRPAEWAAAKTSWMPWTKNIVRCEIIRIRSKYLTKTKLIPTISSQSKTWWETFELPAWSSSVRFFIQSTWETLRNRQTYLVSTSLPDRRHQPLLTLRKQI